MPSLLRRFAGGLVLAALARGAWRRPRPKEGALPDGGHEPDGVRTRIVLAVIGGLVLFVGLTFFGERWLFDHFVSQRLALQEPIQPMAEDVPPPRPRLQVDPTAELAEVRTRASHLLAGEGVGLPIQAAMAAIAARGDAAYAPLLPPAPPPYDRRARAAPGERP